MKYTIQILAAMTSLLLMNSRVDAGTLSLRIGPAASGAGGTNPVGIPPGIQDLDVGYVTASKWESTFSVFPGIFLGKRLDFGGPYMSVGGGLVISQNGIGPGPYTAFGWDIGHGSLRFNMEYKQALGLTSNGIAGPYAVRLGIAWY